MADIDMIPRRYREGVRVRRTLRRTGIALAIVVLAAGAGHATLRWQAAALDRQAEALRNAAARAQSAQAHNAALWQAHDRRQQADALLRAARRQGELAAFAQAIDASLPADAWLTGIVLRREIPAGGTGSPQAGGAASAQGGGTDSAQGGSAASAQGGGGALAAASLAELSGQAASYEAVTAFLARLARAPGIAGVQLRSSGANGAARAVDFRAVVTLAWKDRP